jgi:hydrogenase nickel incorporation protein HypA/HybF
MHELGIASGILSSAITAAENVGATTISSVDVSIGVLTEVMEDALQFAWDELRQGTMAENAALTVTMLGARSRCADCGHDYEHGRYDAARCPSCGSYVVMLLQGRELDINRIDAD